MPIVDPMPVINSLEKFISDNALLIDSVFIKKEQKKGYRNKLSSLLYKVSLYLYKSYIISFLTLLEPLLVVSQLELRRVGGLAGSYQFHWLYEIRNIVKNKSLNSAIEFRSGASTISFC